MTRQLLPISGRPADLRVLAATLTGSARRLSAVHTALLSLRSESAWDSEAGRAFAVAAQAPPASIAALVERYTGAGRAVRAFADALEVAQADAYAASWSHQEAWRRHDVYLERRGLATDPVEQQDLERAMNEEIRVIAAAEQRHARACEQREDADRQCATVLRGLADDVLDDPGGYTWLANSQKVTGWTTTVGMWLPGQLKVLGLGSAAVGTGSDVAMLVIYDEGSWTKLGVNALSTAGKALVAGSAVAVSARLVGGTRVFTKTANPSVGYRTGAGIRSTFDDWIRPWKQAVGMNVAAPVARVPAKVPAKVTPGTVRPVDRAGTFLRDKVDDAVLAGWGRATAAGPAAQRMFVAGVTLQRAPSASQQVLSATEGVEHYRQARSRQEREQRAAGSVEPGVTWR